MLHNTSIQSPEIWRGVPGWERYYHVSNLGRVKSLPRIVHLSDGRKQRKGQRIMKPKVNSHGYLQVQFCANGLMEHFLINRLVATLFIRVPLPGEEANHKDGIKFNNNVDNLEWGSHAHNMKHAVDTGLKNHKKGKHPLARKVVDNSTGKIYECMQDAADAVGMSKTLLHYKLTGKQKNKTSLSFL